MSSLLGWTLINVEIYEVARLTTWHPRYQHDRNVLPRTTEINPSTNSRDVENKGSHTNAPTHTRTHAHTHTRTIEQQSRSGDDNHKECFYRLTFPFNLSIVTMFSFWRRRSNGLVSLTKNFSPFQGGKGKNNREKMRKFFTFLHNASPPFLLFPSLAMFRKNQPHKRKFSRPRGTPSCDFFVLRFVRARSLVSFLYHVKLSQSSFCPNFTLCRMKLQFS